jgi:glutamine amidotransferase
MGNLFSVKHACSHVGLEAAITSSPDDILRAEAVILPGVGAFGDAMKAVERLDLVGVLRDVAASSKPLVGICLGMQLLMTESFEFGRHSGLGIIPGTVARIENPERSTGLLKVPHVCWNQLYRVPMAADPWAGSLLEGLPNGVYMYFVHSFQVVPEKETVVLATTRYGNIEFCSALRYENIFGCQCHPERSGPQGLRIYHNLAARLKIGMTSRVVTAHA